MRSNDIERFIREHVDKSARIEGMLGLELSQRGVLFEYVSENQKVMLFLEYAAAATLVLAPSYAPRQQVDEIVARETFQDAELQKLGDLHHKILLWLRETVDESFQASDGRFFSAAEPLPDGLYNALQNILPLSCKVSILGYPTGVLHLYMDIPLDSLDFESQDVSTGSFSISQLKDDVEGVKPDEEDVPLPESPLPPFMNMDNVLRFVLGFGVFVLALQGWTYYASSKPEVVKPVDDNRLRFQQVRIPGGSFIMGCSGTVCAMDESPHRVTITHDFFMLESEVTQRQYQYLMKEDPSTQYQCGLDCPVDSVTWEQAIQFANRFSVDQGYQPCYTQESNQWLWDEACLGWRLPTEAEWERAALGWRNNKTTGEEHVPIPFTSTAWYLNPEIVSELPSTDDGKPLSEETMSFFVSTHPVCEKAKNGYGLCDMSGNVWEWVWDWYDPNMPEQSHNRQNPKGAAIGRSRVLKGGGFHSPELDILPHRRAHLTPWATKGTVRFENEKPSIDIFKGAVGFRLVRTAK